MITLVIVENSNDVDRAFDCLGLCGLDFNRIHCEPAQVSLLSILHVLRLLGYLYLFDCEFLISARQSSD